MNQIIKTTPIGRPKYSFDKMKNDINLFLRKICLGKVELDFKISFCLDQNY